MGMFDYLVCEARLPIEKESYVRQELNPFQTKDVGAWRQPNLEFKLPTIKIDQDNRLLDPEGMVMTDFSGEVCFYGASKNLGWCEFKAIVENGVVKNIVVVESPKSLKEVKRKYG
jgi:hypothetical protein